MPETKTIDNRIPLSTDEKRALAEELTALTLKINEIEKEKKEYDKAKNAEIKENQAYAISKAMLLDEGHRTIPTDCYLVINREKNIREWVSVETGEIVQTEAVQPGDNQLALEEAEEVPAAAEDQDMDTFEDIDEDVADSEAEAFPDEGDDAEEGEDDAEEEEGDADESEDDEEADDDDGDDGEADDDHAAEEDRDDEPAEEAEDPEDDASDLDHDDPDPDDVFGLTEDEYSEDDTEPDTDVQPTDEDLKFDIKPGHEQVLKAVAATDFSETDAISFGEQSGAVQAAAEHLLAMGYLAGDSIEQVEGFTEAGQKLYDEKVD